MSHDPETRSVKLTIDRACCCCMVSHNAARDTYRRGHGYPHIDGTQSGIEWAQRGSESRSGTGQARHGSEWLRIGPSGCYLSCGVLVYSLEWTVCSRGSCSEL